MYSNCYSSILPADAAWFHHKVFLCLVLFNTVSLHYKIMTISGIILAAHGFFNIRILTCYLTPLVTPRIDFWF